MLGEIQKEVPEKQGECRIHLHPANISAIAIRVIIIGIELPIDP
jgi:hypothetical protein